MPRTPIDDELIHASDAGVLDERTEALWTAFEPGARAWAQTALVREAAALAAGQWLAEARGALAGVLRDPALLTALDVQGATDALSNAIATEIPAPDADDVAAHGSDVARALAGAWAELLAARLGDAADARVALDEALLPRDDADALADLDEALDAYGLRGDALRAVLCDAARALFAGGVREVELPSGARVVRAASGALEARRVLDGPSAALAHSGERVRDGASPPAERARTDPRRR